MSKVVDMVTEEINRLVFSITKFNKSGALQVSVTLWVLSCMKCRIVLPLSISYMSAINVSQWWFCMCANAGADRRDGTTDGAAQLLQWVGQKESLWGVE